jgi:hypothetical protein
MHAFDRHPIRFAIWVGPGRDPEVAYLDARQLVLTSSELTTDGLALHATGRVYNILGGSTELPLDAAVSHRIRHAALDRTGSPWFVIDGSGPSCIERDGLCDLAEPNPVPRLPYHDPGSFALGPNHALRWVTWDDPLRADILRHAVYLDDRRLLESAAAADGRPRVWPARGLRTTPLELVAPDVAELAAIGDRFFELTRPRPGSAVNLG